MKLRERAADLTAYLTRWAYEPYPSPDANGRDPWRWCVYCGCDCYEDEPQHQGDCALGLRPLRPKDLGMRGPRDPYAHGMRCMDCGVEFKVGDLTALRPIDDDIFESVCLGCRVLNPGVTAE